MQEVVMLTFTPESLAALIDERIQEALDKHTAKVWLSEKEAQSYTGFSQFTLYNARKAKELKASKCKQSTRYHRDDLDAWLRSKQER